MPRDRRIQRVAWLVSRSGGRLFAVVAAHATVNAPFTFWEQVSVGTAGAADQLRIAWYALESAYAVAGFALIVAQWRWWTEAPAGAASDLGPTVRPDPQSTC